MKVYETFIESYTNGGYVLHGYLLDDGSTCEGVLVTIGTNTRRYFLSSSLKGSKLSFQDYCVKDNTSKTYEFEKCEKGFTGKCLVGEEEFSDCFLKLKSVRLNDTKIGELRSCYNDWVEEIKETGLSLYSKMLEDRINLSSSEDLGSFPTVPKLCKDNY